MLLPSKSEGLGRYNTKLRHVWKKSLFGLDYWQTDKISLKNIYFSLILYVVFILPSQCFFPKLQLHVVKNWNNFCYSLFICISSKSVSPIFEIVFQTGDIDRFVLCSVISFLYFEIESSFSREKSPAAES